MISGRLSASSAEYSPVGCSRVQVFEHDIGFTLSRPIHIRCGDLNGFPDCAGLTSIQTNGGGDLGCFP